MKFWFGPRIRHPFFPGLHATPAAEAKPLSPALYGSFQELVRAAEGGALVRRAVFVSHIVGESERNLLWRRFQVPVFVVLADPKGRVVAYECEAQNGLHVSDATAAETAVCDCGRPGLMTGLRLQPLLRMPGFEPSPEGG